MAGEGSAGEQIDPVILAQRVRKLPEEYRECIDLMKRGDLPEACVQLISLGEVHVQEVRQHKHILGTMEAALKDQTEKELLLERTQNALEAKLSRMETELRHLRSQNEAKTTELLLLKQTMETQSATMDEAFQENYDKLERCLLERDEEISRLQEIITDRDRVIATSQAQVAEQKKDLQLMHEINEKAIALSAKVDACIRERANMEALLVEKDTKIQELHNIIIDMGEKSLRDKQTEDLEIYKRVATNSVSLGPDVPLEKSIRFSTRIEVIEEGENGVIERRQQELKKRRRRVSKVSLGDSGTSTSDNGGSASATDLEYEYIESDSESSNDITKETIHRKPVHATTQTEYNLKIHKILQVSNEDDKDLIMELKRALLIKIREIYKIKLGLGIVNTVQDEILKSDLFNSNVVETLVLQSYRDGLWEQDLELMRALTTQNYKPVDNTEQPDLKNNEKNEIHINRNAIKSLVSLLPVSIPDSLWEIRCNQAMMRQHELEAEIHRLERLNSRLCADIHAIITEQDSMYKLVKDNKDTRGKQKLITSVNKSQTSAEGSSDASTLSTHSAIVSRMNTHISSILNPPLSSGHGGHLLKILNSMVDSKKTTEFFYDTAVRYRSICYNVLEQFYSKGRLPYQGVKDSWSSSHELSLLINDLTAARNRIIMFAERIDELTAENELLQRQVNLQARISLQDLSSLDKEDSIEALYARCMVAEGLASMYSSLLLQGHGLRCKEMEESLRLFNEENDLLLTKAILQTSKQASSTTQTSSISVGSSSQHDSAGLQLAFLSIKRCAEALLEGEASYRICNSLALILESETPTEYSSRLAAAGIIYDEVPPQQVGQHSGPSSVPTKLSAVEHARRSLTQQSAWQKGRAEGGVIIRPSEGLQAELQTCFAESKAFNNLSADDKKVELKALKLRLQGMKSRISSLCEGLGEIITLPPLTDNMTGDFSRLTVPSTRATTNAGNSFFHHTLHEDVSMLGTQENGMLILSSSKRIVSACERRISTLEQLNTELADRIYREVTRLSLKLGAIRFICCKKDKIRSNLSNIRSLYTQALRSFKATEESLRQQLTETKETTTKLEKELQLYSTKKEAFSASVQCDILQGAEYDALVASIRTLKDEKQELMDQVLALQAENTRLQNECKDVAGLRVRLQKLYNAYTGSVQGCKAIIESYAVDIEKCIQYHRLQSLHTTPTEHGRGASAKLSSPERQFDVQDLLLSGVRVEPEGAAEACKVRLGDTLGRVFSKFSRMSDRFTILREKVLQLQQENEDLREKLFSASIPTKAEQHQVGDNLGERPSSSLQMYSDSTGDEKLSLSFLDLLETANGPMSASSVQNLMRNKIRLLQEELLSAKKQISEFSGSQSDRTASSIGCQVSLVNLDAPMDSSITTPAMLHFVRSPTSLRRSDTFDKTVTVSVQTMIVHTSYKSSQSDLSHMDIVSRIEYEDLANRMHNLSALNSKVNTSMPPDVALSLYTDSITTMATGVGTQTPRFECQDCKNMQDMLTAAQIEVEELKEEIKIKAREADCELLQVRAKLESAMESIQMKVDKCNMLERLLRDENAKVQGFMQQVADMQERERSHEGALSNIQAMLKAEHANSLAKKDKKLAELQKNLEGVVAANEKMQAKNKSLHADVVRLKKDLDARRSTPSAKSPAVLAKAEEVEALNKELTVAKGRIRTLVSELRAAKQTIQQQQKQHEAYHSHPALQPSPRVDLQTQPLRPQSARAPYTPSGSEYRIPTKDRPLPRSNSAGSFTLSRTPIEPGPTLASREPISPRLPGSIERAVNSELRNIDYMIKQYEKYPNLEDTAPNRIYHEPTSGLILDESDRRHLLGALSDEDISAILTM
ncbi:Hypothetical protein DHA2_112787 [Giardia duodenalis]|uniref:Coiled-coil protein n=1 Tax=Giardia intestinalis TaxID=5741 RepID=V6TG92_GIAIN|nr:Hypothetical protein DHA2_112787 [Giardia intestinalis]